MTIAAVGLVVLVIVVSALERYQWAQERATLLQRIQAPEVAVAEHAAQDAGDPATVRFDDDDAFWKAVKDERA